MLHAGCSLPDYSNKLLLDLTQELDHLFQTKRINANGLIIDLINQLYELYGEIMVLGSREVVDSKILTDTLNRLNKLEHKAVQGAYGAQAQICPLNQPGQLVHHVRMKLIPDGQATVRDLIEKCHQLLTRIVDKMEDTPLPRSATHTRLGKVQEAESKTRAHYEANKKFGDIMDEMDKLLIYDPVMPRGNSSHAINKLKRLYLEIKALRLQESVDPAILTAHQACLNEIENKETQGGYGDPSIYRIHMKAIPQDHATIRSLIEKCHHLLTRIMKNEKDPTCYRDYINVDEVVRIHQHQDDAPAVIQISKDVSQSSA